ncbi:hypothetical protein [Streptomyces flavofungini]|uniref:hypothetical protein n=1 Tax=Streptomyces flavofungini TaxID=68200 RepID=UPI0025AF6119|nr:hypothetical protein [Streptomyces flavofungini]WJV49390.1 hypothetical protein QUY26_30080 [Streptomyces flavofungini]
MAAGGTAHTGAWPLVPGLADALGAAMPWVVAAFVLCALLCPALPRRAVERPE